MELPEQTPYRQIRAQFDDQTITVYQAYQASIAEAAVKHQKLNASPDFKPGRMTWVKPSWAWMMYRCGYSYKDDRQARVLALRMKHIDFVSLLEKGQLSTHGSSAKSEGPAEVRVQWDPERTPTLQVLPYRSIQIGISGSLSTTWADDMIFSIKDVTEKAQKLKECIDSNPDVTLQDLIAQGLVPDEKPFAVPEHVIKSLEMDISPPDRKGGNK